MEQDERPVSINISAVPVAGVGGLGLVAMAVVVSVFFPAIGWMMAAGAASGVVLALALVAFRRLRDSSGPSGDDPKILFRDLPAEAGSHAGAHRQGPAPDCEPRTSNLEPRPSNLDPRPSTLDPRYSTL